MVSVLTLNRNIIREVTFFSFYGVEYVPSTGKIAVIKLFPQEKVKSANNELLDFSHFIKRDE